MSEPDPLKKMLDQLQLLVKLVNERGFAFSGEPLPEDLEEKLNQLESEVILFKAVTAESLKQLGVKPTAIAENIIGDKKEALKNRQVIRQATHLKEEVAEIKWMINRVARIAEKQETKGQSEGSPEKKRARKHRKRYKRLGDDKWKAI